MNGENSEADEESNGLEVDFIATDEASEITPEMMNRLNGISDKDAPKVFEFTCIKRVFDPSMDGYNYHVKPIDEYDDLDFKGHVVLINGRERLCHSFEVSEGAIIIFVAETL